MKKKFIKFMLLGGVTYGFNLGITFLCHELLGIDFSVSYFFALCVSIIVSFILSLKVVFKAEFRLSRFLFYICILLGVGLMNYYFVDYFVDFLPKMYQYLLIIFMTTLGAVIKFFLYNKLVFTKEG